ncbi:hypothetical protein DFQ27_008079 [Actinomortierella ambigua]|uniref:Uncharacterized protein n=1 Tax=Actinomortierella ambigua TaxID=1343610 RepID=A0A9P6PS68_9FUNG|nr:hypothetical protein DFQ27_008079 [Actinomortierella ambigua]
MLNPKGTPRKWPYRTSNYLQGLVAFLALFCAVCDSAAMAIEGPYLYVGRVPCELVIFSLYLASLIQTGWHHRQQRRLYHATKRRGLRLSWSLPALLALLFVWVGELIGTAINVSRWNDDLHEREATAPGFDKFQATLWNCLPDEHHCLPRNMAWCGIVALTLAYTADAVLTWRTKWPQDEAEYWEGMQQEGAMAGRSAAAVGTLPPMGIGAVVVDGGETGQFAGDKDRQYYRLDTVKHA